MIEVRNLSFAYGREAVLRDVSFVVSPGETVGISRRKRIGEDDSPENPLVNLAAPLSGTVMADGQNVFSHPLRYRRQVGYLPENVALYDDMTVKGYLQYRACLKGEPAKRVRRRISEAAEMCQIGDLMRTPVTKLSAGLRKRVALADALLLRPRVLLLDDFLAGLDFDMRKAAGEILSSAASFSSVIATGHDIWDFAQWTTRFLVLRGGVVAAKIETSGLDQETLRERIEFAMRGNNR